MNNIVNKVLPLGPIRTFWGIIRRTEVVPSRPIVAAEFGPYAHFTIMCSTGPRHDDYGGFLDLAVRIITGSSRTARCHRHVVETADSRGAV